MQESFLFIIVCCTANKLYLRKRGDEMLSIFIKGLLIGSTLSVPGVSGGTMAMLMGIYEPLVRAINKLITREEKKKEAIIFLLVFSIGGVTGFLTISSVILNLILVAPMPMTFLFCGVIAGGVPKIFGEIKKERFMWSDFFFIFLGAVIVFFISYLPKDLFQISVSLGMSDVIKQIFGGLIIAFALVLPGISVSHMLYVLGIYEGIIKAVSKFNVLSLLPMICGVSIGILLFTRLMDICFIKHRKTVYTIIFGFVAGSVFELLFHGISGNFSFVCIPLFIIGYCAIRLILKKQADA